MGDKIQAKLLIESLNIPCIPGCHSLNIDSETSLLNEAKRIGFPLLIKAAAGGGGKGMRIVHHPQAFLSAFKLAQAEAENFFGAADLLLEKFIAKPRHIEIQIIADQQGNVACLGSRDCSIQRRHQKIIEEAPAPKLSDTVLEDMIQAATTIAHQLKYVGVGTLEFLVDAADQFYFMEMNTRLQVEHTVTEMVYDLDLVAWQIRIANGESIPWAATPPTLHGHAIEARIYAEDPHRDFLPCVGKILKLHEPSLPFIRIESGLSQGDTITSYYDPMLSKVVAWGETRELARQRLSQALAAYHIVGCTHNIAYLRDILASSCFQFPPVTTDFIEDNRDLQTTSRQSQTAAWFCALYLRMQLKTNYDPWHLLPNWQLNLPARKRLHLIDLEQQQYTLDHQNIPDGILDTETNTQYTAVSTTTGWRVFINGNPIHVQFIQNDQQTYVTIAQQTYAFMPYQYLPNQQTDQVDHLTAPMNGTIISHLVKTGHRVKAGDHLLILEAMKMQYTIKAPFDGYVQKFHFHEGEQVIDGSKLLDLEALDA